MSNSTPSQLPTSVRGAPAELRRLIRKRQNSESAKRCRLRRKLEAANEAGAQVSTTQKMVHLENLVAQLAQGLAQTQNALAALLNTPPVQLPLPPLGVVGGVSQSLPTSPMSPTSPTADNHGNSLQIPPLAEAVMSTKHIAVTGTGVATTVTTNSTITPTVVGAPLPHPGSTTITSHQESPSPASTLAVPLSLPIPAIASGVDTPPHTTMTTHTQPQKQKEEFVGIDMVALTELDLALSD